MDSGRFDRLTVLLTGPASRRSAVTGVLLALAAPLLSGPKADAKKKRKKKRCRPKCAGKVCGPNGCRGSCGPGCAAEEFCRDGVCVECLSRANCPADPSVCQTFVCNAAGSCVEALVADGTSCGGDNQCRDGACVSPPVCGGRNDSCTLDGQCCSNSCNLDPQLLVCNASPNGGDCRVDFDCASGNCVAFVCA